MKDLNKPRFEEEWRKAFEEAELSPNNDVWARVDAHLANQETKKYKKRLIWFQRIAAGVLLLLLGTGAGLWMSRQTEEPQLTQETGLPPATGSDVARLEGGTAAVPAEVTSPSGHRGGELTKKRTDHTQKGAQLGPQSGTSTGALAKNHPATSGRPDGGTGKSALDISTAPALAKDRSGKSTTGTGRAKRSSESTTGNPDAYLARGGRNNRFGANDSGGNDDHRRATSPTLAETVATAEPEAKGIPTPLAVDGRLAVAGISPKTLLAQEPVIRPRSILPHVSEAYWAKVVGEEGKAAPKADVEWDRWQVALAFAPGVYQPNFRVNESSSTFMNTVSNISAANFGGARMDASTLSAANRDLETATAQGLSYQTGVQLEYALSRRLSVQSGMDYLYNSSSVNTYSYVRNFQNGRNEPAFASFLNYGNQSRAESLTEADALPSVDYSSALSVTNTKSLSVAGATPVQNVYEYVGIPVRVNYKLLTRKLGATLGAGVSGDFFLSNRFGNEEKEIDEVRISSTKGTAYRKLGFSAWLGLKMQYRFARKYSVFVEPSYRTAITSFTNTPALQSRPSLFGVGTGLQMLF